MAGDSWQDIDFEVALSSIAAVHVCSLEVCPGYELHGSPGSTSGRMLLMRTEGSFIIWATSR